MSILSKWTDYFKNFVSDQRGVVAIIFGIAAIPIVGLVGASLDYSRAANVQSQLQDALDGSILTVAHERDLSDAQMEAAVRTQIEAMVGGAHGADSLTLTIERAPDDDTLVEISATMKIDTSILAIMGINDIIVGADAAVSVDFQALEVVLVLDNTGSMRSSNRIGSLREAASDFVEVVTEDGTTDNVKIALVPYTAQVNIGNTVTMEQYLDTEGLSEHHAQLIEGALIAEKDDCGGRGSGGRGRGGRHSSAEPTVNLGDPSTELAQSTSPVPGFARMNFWDVYASVINELIGVSAANAATVEPYELVEDGCDLYNPDQISHWQLYEQLDGIDWKGCVEARPEPYDATDEAPDSGDPDTLWVPGFWIDDSGWYDTNDWLSDREPDDADFEDYGEHYNVEKYSSSSGHDVDEIPNTTLGPAQNCGDPIVPLTDNFSLIEDSIDDMTYWSSGGTVTAQGVVWGWRTLSPSAPFTEGAPYDEVSKVMVVMTDGRNELVSSYNDALGSHYSAYGHLESGRLPSSSVSAARDYIDERTLAACANAKAAGIIVYTVTFGLDSSSEAMWDTCATEESMAYHVDSSSELVGAFNDIADSVGELRLTR